jgi:flagellar biosynthesis/type III secretory pathway protein FliH
MSDYDNGYDEGYRAGMQKMREVGQARIEELEQTLAKAVEALEFYRSAINLRIDCEITYAMQEAHDNAETFLAELKGEDRG